MRDLWAAGVDPGHHQDCVRLFTMASVEFAHLSQELGVFDRDRIQEIATLFDVPLQSVTEAWWAASHAMSEGFERRKRAAQPRFEAGELAVIAHRPLFEMIDASRAFEKTPERDHALFGKAPGRGRIYTGMRTLDPVEDWRPVSAVPNGPGATRFTTAERKELAVELGVRIETVRKYEVDLSAADFDAWADRRRRATSTRLKNEAEKKRRAGRRRRKAGKTAAVRDFARRTGWSVRKAWDICKGLSVDEVIARTPIPTMRELPRHGSGNDNCTGMPNITDEEVSRFSSRCSDKCSDKSDKNRAFLRNSSPDTAAADDANAATKAPSKSKRRGAITLTERWLLTEWFQATHGRAPSESLFRKWRARRVLRSNIEQAADWLNNRTELCDFHDDNADHQAWRADNAKPARLPLNDADLPF